MSTVGQLLAGETYSSSSGIPGSFGFFGPTEPTPGGTIGKASFPAPGNTASLIDSTPVLESYKGSCGCGAKNLALSHRKAGLFSGSSSTGSTSGGGLINDVGRFFSDLAEDLFGPTGICLKCLTTWVVVGIVLLLILLWSGNEDE